MRSPAEGWVDANGVRLHYLDWGRSDARALLVLHGGSAHAHWWDLFADAVADEYRVVALDLRGHGDSRRPEPAAYGIDDYVADVVALVGALGLPRLSVIGHSMGALVAAAYASAAAVPIEALVLVDIRIRPSRGGKRYIDRLRQWPHPVFPSRAEGIRRFRLLPSGTAAAPEVLAHVAGHGLRDLADGRATPKFERAALSDAAVRDISGDLQRLRCPILYIRGAESIFVPRSALEELRVAVPSADTAEVPGAHHHVMLDDPPGFERAVREFLKRHGL